MSSSGSKKQKNSKNQSPWRFDGGVMYLPEEVRLKNWKRSIKNFENKDSSFDPIVEWLKKEGKERV